MRGEKEKTEAINILKDQVNIEKQLVELYGKTAGLIISLPVRRLLRSIQLDSMKHIEICQTAIEVLQGEEFQHEDKNELKVGLEHHVKLERKSIDMTNRMLKNPWIRDNKGLATLIEKLREEEIKHHRTLQRLITEGFKQETLMDDLYGYRLKAKEIFKRELFPKRKS